MNYKEILKQKFGYDDFRDGQEETILSLLNKQDTFAILPTGTGKSLCYQLPTYIWNKGLTVVVSPLLSLMHDQVMHIHKRGERRVCTLTSELSFSEKKQILANLQNYRYLFLSPEMINQEEVLKSLQNIEISLFVIDEAHCITQWGIDFRPEYRVLGDVLVKLNNPLTLALTATVTKQDQEEISKLIFTKEPHYIRTTVNRPNLYYEVIKTVEKDKFLQLFLEQYEGPGIIYFTSKKEAERVTLLLKNNLNLPVATYHADLDNLERKSIQDQFINNKIEILCATTAFGMGVNKSNLRFVIHYHLSASIEAFMQESGRVGRDGKKALSLILYQNGDEFIHRNMIENTWFEYKELSSLLISSTTYLTDLQKKWLLFKKENIFFNQLMENQYLMKKKQLQQMKEYIDCSKCRRAFLLSYFEEDVQHQVDYCCDLDMIDLDIILSKRDLITSQGKIKFDYQQKIKQFFKLA